MIYDLLADTVAFIHFTFIGFVGLGAFLALKWPPALRIHLPALAWSTVVVPVGIACPLTTLEKSLRRRAHDAIYPGGFIDHYVHEIPTAGIASIHTTTVVACSVVAGYLAIVLRRSWVRHLDVRNLDQPDRR